MLNHVEIMGRLVRDPELRTTQNQLSVTSFTLAVDRDFGGRDGGDKQTDFIDCVAWRSTAEFVNKYFQKGSMAVVTGRLQIREWTDKDNNKRRNAEIVVDNIYFGDSKRKESSSDNYGSNSYVAPAASSPVSEAVSGSPFSALSDDDDGELPF